MTAPSSEVQALIYAALVADTGVHAICADRILDRVKKDTQFPYVSFGPSDAVEDDADCITGRVITLQVDCWSRYQGGFREVQQLADAVEAALHRYEGELAVNALVELRWRGTRVLRDPDGQTSHAVVTVEATIEDA